MGSACSQTDDNGESNDITGLMECVASDYAESHSSKLGLTGRD